MRRHALIALRYTLVTTILFGLAYPLLVTGLAQFFLKDKANGQLIRNNGVLVGSRLIGQQFTSPMYFHSRPSAAGNGYDAANSSGSNYAPTNQKLIDRVTTDVVAVRSDHPGLDVPVDLVTASASGLDPHITPASADYQVARVAQQRQMPESTVRSLVAKHLSPRQFGVLGEARVNVLELNLDLDNVTKKANNP